VEIGGTIEGSQRLDTGLDEALLGTLGPFTRAAARRLIDWPELQAIQQDIHSRTARLGFLPAVLDTLDVRLEVSPEDIARIPRTGPVVVVANHPFGILEGLALLRLLSSVRPDVRVIANSMVVALSGMADGIIPVDVFAAPGVAPANHSALREAVRFLRSGGMLLTFPAGEVAHLQPPSFRVADPAWKSSVAGIIRLGRAAVLPVFFPGANGPAFQVLGLLHPMLRTLMLPRELLRKRGSTLQMRVGSLLPRQMLEQVTGDQALIDLLRERTFLLQARSGVSAVAARARKLRKPPRRGCAAVAESESADAVSREVAALLASQRLVEHGSFDVCWARSEQIPATLFEIGRLRELTFREVGEGTGRARDLDRFDAGYWHLFLWDHRQHQVAGAYRIGATDEICRRPGGPGLYTQTLFSIRPRLLEDMGPALELGRSFIRAEYQRDPAALLLLWRGIGRLVIQNPRYATLFGPVSISDDYSPLSRDLIITFLRSSRLWTEGSRQVRPHRGVRIGLGRAGYVRSLLRGTTDEEGVSALVKDVELDRKGIPILLKHYLKLGGRVLGFNVDPDFGSCVDALIAVDLRATEPRLLERYMGTAGVQSFLAFHGLASSRPQAA
jgi:putative hemolysin